MLQPENEFSTLTHYLQAAIAPVILISGIGLLLLSLTNRLGRLIDRSRQLARDFSEAPASHQSRINAQIDVIYKRAHYLKFATFMAGLSILLVAVLIICLFLGSLFAWNGTWLLVTLFISILLCLILSMGAFLFEVHLSLEALKVELDDRRRDVSS